MEISTIRGLAFFGILFIASVLLSPGVFFTFLTHRRQAWVVRRWTNQLEAQSTILLTGLPIALLGWLVYNSHRDLLEKEQKQARQDSTSVGNSSGMSLGTSGLQARP